MYLKEKNKDIKIFLADPQGKSIILKLRVCIC
jgi:cysteine synthase